VSGRRGAERALLLWCAPLAALAAWGLAAAKPLPAESFLPTLGSLALVWGACFALHLLLCLIRFDGDARAHARRLRRGR